MKEYPILFNASMVRAILNGSKTQTRRPLYVLTKNAGSACFDKRYSPPSGYPCVGSAYTLSRWRSLKPGDQLWVRETSAEISCRLTYRADTDDGAHCMVKRWTPSIHMPRDWSRIQLEIVSVRVERLQDISEEDARAEGVTPTEDPTYFGVEGEHLGLNARESYANLWEAINGSGSCDANPWVSVIEFKKVDK